MLREETVNYHMSVNITKADVPTISTANTVVAKRAVAVRRDGTRILTVAEDALARKDPNEMWYDLVRSVAQGTLSHVNRHDRLYRSHDLASVCIIFVYNLRAGLHGCLVH